jgi:hypothetical protein
VWVVGLGSMFLINNLIIYAVLKWIILIYKLIVDSTMLEACYTAVDKTSSLFKIMLNKLIFISCAMQCLSRVLQYNKLVLGLNIKRWDCCEWHLFLDRVADGVQPGAVADLSCHINSIEIVVVHDFLASCSFKRLSKQLLIKLLGYFFNFVYLLHILLFVKTHFKG